MIYDNMQELIGNTPMVSLHNFEIEPSLQIYAKLELWNPSGSVKDRTGLYMVQDAEKRGLLHPGDTIVEATAGNTGLGIAFAALNKGYRIIFVVPEKFSIEKQTLMKSLGAEIVHTPREGGMLMAAARAEELKKELGNAISLQQFKNPANPLAHYETTGKEIYEQMDCQIDYFVAGAGSGGTYTGIMKYLKEKNKGIKGILADPVGSTMGGGEHGDYNIEGIGNDFVADTMDMSLVDQVIKINDKEAYEGARKLASLEGIIAGSSSGAAIAATVKLEKMLIKNGNDKKRIVTLFPDRGDRYFSKQLFD